MNQIELSLGELVEAIAADSLLTLIQRKVVRLSSGLIDAERVNKIHKLACEYIAAKIYLHGGSSFRNRLREES